MKSSKLRLFLLAASFFAFSATFAQDTTNKPKPDTSKSPKPDTTKIEAPKGGGTSGSNVSAVNASLTKNEDKVAAKKEETTK